MTESSDKILLRSKEGLETVASKSKVIQNYPMVYRKFLQSSTKSEIILRLPVSPSKLSKLINFIDTGKLPFISIDDAFETHEFIKTNGLKSIEKKGEEYLIHQINPRNVCRIYEFACRQEKTVLQYHCWKTFDQKCHEILSGAEFLQCEEITVFRYLTRPIYESLKEKVLFMSVYKWSKNKAEERFRQQSVAQTTVMPRNLEQEIRATIQPFLPFIRFLVMPVTYLENQIFKLNLFSDKEIQGIRQYFINKDKKCLPNSFCDNDSMRNNEVYSTLFEYKKYKLIRKKMYEVFEKPMSFFSEIKIKEDCFVTHVDLPFCIINFPETVKVIVARRNINKSDNLEERGETCSHQGIIDMKEPLFLRKGMQYQLQVIIAEERLKNHNIQLKQRLETYLEESINKITNAYYFRVTLYF